MLIETLKHRLNRTQPEQGEQSSQAASDHLVVSLLGPTGSGKSTVARSTATALEATYGLKVAIIQKDTALREMSKEKFGSHNDWGGYTPAIYFGKNRYTTTDIHRRMNAAIHQELEHGAQVIFLEGGTRTRRARTITLNGIHADYLVVKLLINPIKIFQNLRRRRSETTRNDDHLAIMAGKLFRQYTNSLMHRIPAPREHYVKINANKAKEEVAEQTLRIIEKRLGLQ